MTTTTKTKLTRSQIITQLKKGECIVTYKKKATGKSDTMRCTLDEDIIPEIVTGKLGGENKEVIIVWNTIKYGWRSFRVDSFKSIKPV